MTWKIGIRLFPISRKNFFLIIIIFALLFRLFFLPSHMPADYHADTYESRVILNNPFDTYTKNEVDQTSKEASYWTKEESSPYPPFGLFLITGIYAMGELTGLGFWAVVVLIELLFVFIFAFLCYRHMYDRMFPLMVLNPFIVFRVWMQLDTTYMLMTYTVIIAFFIAMEKKRILALLIMSFSFCIKFAPIYFYRALLKMSWKERIIVIMVPLLLIVLPIFFFDNYLYIYTFHGDRNEYSPIIIISALILFMAGYLLMEYRLRFDVIDIITYSFLPFSVFTSLKIGYWKYIAWAMMIPDRRYLMNMFGITLAIIWGVLEVTVKPENEQFTPFVVGILIFMCPMMLLIHTRWRIKLEKYRVIVNKIWNRFVEPI